MCPGIRWREMIVCRGEEPDSGGRRVTVGTVDTVANCGGENSRGKCAVWWLG